MIQGSSRSQMFVRGVLTLVVCVAAAIGGYAAWQAWFVPPITKEVIARLKDPATREAEVRRLGEAKIVEALPHLARLIDVEQADHRQAVVWAMANIGDRRAIPVIESRAGDASEAVRIEVAQALGRLDAKVNDQGLGRLLGDASPAVREAALRALADDSGSEAVALALQKAARDDAPNVRAVAVEKAAKQPATTAYEVLALAISDDNPDVAAAAKQQIDARRGDLAGIATVRIGSARTDVEYARTGRMLRAVASPAMAATLLDLLDAASSGKRTSASDELVEMVTSTLVSMGAEAGPALVEQVVLEERSSAAEATAAEAIRRIGASAAGSLNEGLRAWRIYPSPSELKRWIAVLGAIAPADEATARTLAWAESQGIAGMDAIVAAAKREIETRSGTTLPHSPHDTSLIAGEPGDEAWKKIGTSAIRVTPADPATQALPDNGVVHVNLKQGLTWSDKPGRKGAYDLLLVFTRKDGKWQQRFHGYAVRFNKRVHVGRILEADDGPGKLRVEMMLNSDLWRHAAFGEYNITLSEGDGDEAARKLTARYTGTCNDEPIAGNAELAMWSHEWPTDAPPPLEPEEHPRLLFRPHHVEALRQRIKTPMGQRIFATLMARLEGGRQAYKTKLNWVTNWEPGMDLAAAHGLLARLYDDKRHAQRAIDLIMPRTEQWPYGGEHGERYPRPMSHYPFAADLLFPDYDEKQRRAVVHCAGHLRIAFSAQWGPVGVFAASRSLSGVPASGALMTVGEQGPLGLPRPSEPPPVGHYQAEKPLDAKVAVVESFQAGGLIRNWVFAGRIASGEDDPLQSLGGREKAWVDEGDQITYRGGTYKFYKLGENAFRGLGGITRDTYLFPPGMSDARCILYTVLKVDQTTAVMVRQSEWGGDASRLYLHGKPVQRGSVAILEPGYHRLLLEVEGFVINPRFNQVRAGYATALRRKYAWQKREYDEALERWNANRQRQDVFMALEMAAQNVRASLWNGEAARKKRGKRGGDMQWPFIGSHWIATGQGLLPDTPWGPASQPDKWSPAQMDDRELCFMMGLAPDPLRGRMAEEFKRRYLDGGQLGRLGCIELIAALVHYPMDLEAR